MKNKMPRCQQIQNEYKINLIYFMLSIKKYSFSEKAKESTMEYVNNIINREKINSYQLKRFKRYIDNKKINFNIFVEKVLLKYRSDKYINFWLKKGIEPPEPLSFFLFEFATKYGKKANMEKYKNYGNTFTSSLYYYDEYYFNLMIGQGSFVKIIKKNK